MSSRIAVQVALLPTAVVMAMLAVMGAGCGSGVSRSSPSAGVSFNLKLASESTAQTLALARSPSPAQSRAMRVVGSNSSSGLASLQLFVKQISICFNLTVTQAQYSGGLNCATLYSGPSGLDVSDPSADQSGLAQTARGTSANFTDLMNDGARAGLGQSSGAAPVGVGTYNWGYIQWAPPIKVQATIFNLSGPTPAFYTQDGNTTSSNDGSGYSYLTTSSTSLTTSPATTAVVLEPNAGSWFRMLSPFPISQSNVTAQNSFVVDLVFDPVGYVTGADSVITGSVIQDSGTDSIQMPPPQFYPIAHAPGQVVMKESYVAPTPTSGTSDAFDTHLDLYYLQGDSDRAIQAAAIRAVPNADSTTVIAGGIPPVAFLRQNGDGTTDFLDYANNPILSTFTRGQATTANVSCQGGASPTTTFNPSGCTNSISLNFAAPRTSSLN